MIPYPQAKALTLQAISACVPAIARPFIRVSIDPEMHQDDGSWWLGGGIHSKFAALRFRVRLDQGRDHSVELLPVK